MTSTSPGGVVIEPAHLFQADAISQSANIDGGQSKFFAQFSENILPKSGILVVE
jgi:hypothetical protein